MNAERDVRFICGVNGWLTSHYLFFINNRNAINFEHTRCTVPILFLRNMVGVWNKSASRSRGRAKIDRWKKKMLNAIRFVFAAVTTRRISWLSGSVGENRPLPSESINRYFFFVVVNKYDKARDGEEVIYWQ